MGEIQDSLLLSPLAYYGTFFLALTLLGTTLNEKMEGSKKGLFYLQDL